MIFTFFAEHNGGTYIDQVRARSLRSAVTVWRARIVKNEAASIRSLEPAEREDRPTPLTGLTNCWCHVCRDSKGTMVLVNIVLTVPGRQRATTHTKK